ncbi:MAG: MerR family transcriptional regulator [Acidimicrobiales bacterium]
MTSTIVSYSGKRTAEIVGITYRQLDYWARTDFIKPSLAQASGSGSRRQYSYSDLLKLKSVKKLIDAGIKLEKVRTIVDYLEELGENVGSANLVIVGSQVTLARDDAAIIDLINRGQGVLNVLPMSLVKAELDDAIVQLTPRSAERSETDPRATQAF